MWSLKTGHGAAMPCGVLLLAPPTSVTLGLNLGPCSKGTSKPQNSCTSSSLNSEARSNSEALRSTHQKQPEMEFKQGSELYVVLTPNLPWPWNKDPKAQLSSGFLLHSAVAWWELPMGKSISFIFFILVPGLKLWVLWLSKPFLLFSPCFIFLIQKLEVTTEPIS